VSIANISTSPTLMLVCNFEMSTLIDSDFMIFLGAKIPKLEYQDMINSTAEVYAHVRWYRPTEYQGDTEISVNKSVGVINKFKGYAYGSCKAQIIRPEVLQKAKITQNVVDFFVILLR